MAIAIARLINASGISLFQPIPSICLVVTRINAPRIDLEGLVVALDRLVWAPQPGETNGSLSPCRIHFD